MTQGLNTFFTQVGPDLSDNISNLTFHWFFKWRVQSKTVFT